MIRRILTLAALVSLATGNANAQCGGCEKPSFGPAIRSAPADNPREIAAADFNDDGIPDVVATIPEEFFVAVFLGTGTGAFAEAVNYPIPQDGFNPSATSVTVADFNADGAADFATAHLASGQVLVYLGVGDGTFETAIESIIGTSAGAIRSTDFNRDGFADLAITNSSPNQISILLGRGDGTFDAATPLPGNLGTSLSVGDFDGDGDGDVAGSGLTVFLGNGDGSFRPPITSDVGEPFLRDPPLPRDLDGDGKTDLIASGPASVLIFHSNGDGTFSKTASYPMSVAVTPIDVGNFDENGPPDLAVRGVVDPSVHVFPGNGVGTFAGTPIPSVLGQLESAFAADLNQDGLTDLVGPTGGSLSSFLADGSGGFPMPPVYPVGVSPVAALALDLTGEGNPDLVTCDTDSDNLSVLTGNGDGTFSDALEVPLGLRPHFIAAADFDRNGAPEVVVATDSGFARLVWAGSGFGLPPVFVGGPSGEIATGDFNDDGKPDVATAGISVYLGNGDGTFQTPVATTTNFTSLLTPADFDGDGKTDLAAADPIDLAILLSKGDGSFETPIVHLGLSLPSSLTTGDFNSDGKMDLAAAFITEDTVGIYLGNGNGTLQEPDIAACGRAPVRIHAADVTGDGKLDLLTGGIGGLVTILTGAGDGTFHRAADYATASTGGAVVTIDSDLDGKLDIIQAGNIQGANSGRVTLLRNSKCEVRRLGVTRQPTSCDVPGEVFGTQPELKVFDDGDNVIECDTGTVTGSLAPGTGMAGAMLSGTTAVAAVAGVATFTDLSIDQPGRGYRLQFSHPLAGITRSRTLSQDISVLLNGPTVSCDSFPPTYRTGSSGYDRYLWKLDDVEVSRAAVPTLAGLSEGDHTLEVTVFQDGCTATDSRTISASSAPPPPSIGAPLWALPGATGLLASVQPHPGNAYLWTVAGGTITAGQGTPQIAFDAGPAGTTMVLEASEISPAGCESAADHFRVQVDFADVPASHPFHDAISSIARNGISKGCGGGNFCPNAILTRAQMAILLLRAEHGGSYQPPPLSFGGTMFADVGPDDFAAAFIQQLGIEKITNGCGGGNYCPNDPVTRAQMAIFLLRVEHGFDYQPPPATGTLFLDVHPLDFGARFIEQLAREGISGGCGNDRFCPEDPVSRAQMAAFLKRTFNLQ